MNFITREPVWAQALATAVVSELITVVPALEHLHGNPVFTGAITSIVALIGAAVARSRVSPTATIQRPTDDQQ